MMRQTYSSQEMEVRGCTGRGISDFHGSPKAFKRKGELNIYPRTIATLRKSTSLLHGSQDPRHSAKLKGSLIPSATFDLVPWQEAAIFSLLGKKTGPPKSQRLLLWFLNFLPG